MAQRPGKEMNYHSYLSDQSSFDSPVGKYQNMMRLGYAIEEKKAEKMPEFISSPSPPSRLPLPVTTEKYSCHQDSVSEESEETTVSVTSKDLLPN